MWNILCYVSTGKKNEIQNKYDEGNDNLKADFEVALEYLIVREKKEWLRPSAARLTKCSEFRDFYEIRFFSNHTQQRPIGYFGPGKNDFTILLWAIEKGNKLIPEGWCTQANKRMNQIINRQVIPVKLILEDEG